MNELVSSLERDQEQARTERKTPRILAVEAIGPLTIVAGVVWAIAQPYRIAFIYREGKGFYDYLVQPPLLVVFVGLLFAFLIAPGLVDDLRETDGSEG
ncbi:MAG TPA: hypothetical protein VJ689_09745 [Gaiellaceae bacterium]|nr:hypothetical protein [Gaiellaceae bacterium]